MPLILKAECRPFGTRPPVQNVSVSHCRCHRTHTAICASSDRHPCRQAVLSAVASLCFALTQPAAHAYNVKLEDVESPAMQSGVQAATEQRWDDAERMFRIVLNEEPDSASAWSNLGNVHLSKGRAKDAFEDFTRAIKLAPTAPVPYLNRAIAEEQLGVDAAAQHDPQLAQQQFAGAVQDCDKAIERDGREFAAWFNKGNAQARLEDYAGALGSYRKAADLAPGIAGYRLREAELMFQEDKVTDADRLMRTVVRKNPSYAEAHAALSAVEWQMGQAGAAEEHFATATAIEPRWRNMEFVHVQTRWPPKLYKAMQKFLSISPG